MSSGRLPIGYLAGMATCASVAALPACKGPDSGNGGAAVDTGRNVVVAMVQSEKAQSADLSTSDIADLVESAVSNAGGLEFIQDGQTVVLKPNLITVYQDAGETMATVTASGINTDWRVTKAVADMVRAKNPTGKILVMEGATMTTPLVYSILGYTAENFGASVDEFVALEGDSCVDTSTSAIEQRTWRSGKSYWVNRRYRSADVVISIPTMATDAWAGIGGGIESMGIGATPAGQYSSGKNPNDCTREKIDRSSPTAAGEFIRDYYGIRPADFVVMDGLQGLEHGPLPVWDDGGAFDYASATKNMRLILAGKDAIAVDTIQALVMKCDPKKVPFLTVLDSDGLGTTDTAKITVSGRQVAEVATSFAGKQTDICPGK
jgi:uncharacterized protein (DUF362 family)